MNKEAINMLINWKDNKERKPVLITGIKCSGKTHLVYKFAQGFFKETYYINGKYDVNKSALSIINEIKDKTSANLANQLNDELISIDNNIENDIVIILDNIDYMINSEEILLEIDKYYSYVIATSSNKLSISDKTKNNIYNIQISPGGFDDFLIALGEEWYVEVITEHFKSNKAIPDIVHQELLCLYECFLEIGGMPGSINDYINFSSSINIVENHDNMNKLFLEEFNSFNNRLNSPDEGIKHSQVYKVLPNQLIKPNKKFQYTLIRKGATRSLYIDAIKNLTYNNYAILCNKLSKEDKDDSKCNFNRRFNNEMPQNFKLYMPDVGILHSNIKIKESNYMEKDKGIKDDDIKRAIHENALAQTLNSKGYTLYFWESDSIAKIEFVIEKENEVLPIEIFLGNNTRSKSLSVFKKSFKFSYSIKISSKNFDFINNIKYLPYYASFCL